MVILIKSSNETFVARKNNETFVLEAGDTLKPAPGTDGIEVPGLAASAGGRTLKLAGTVLTSETGVDVSNLDRSNPDRVIVGATGFISGEQAGISVLGQATRIVNRGFVEGGDFGISVSARVALLNNEGTIESSDAAVILNGEISRIDNAGKIRSTSGTAIVSDDRFDIRNSGMIVAGDIGILVTEPSEQGSTIRNTGLIFADTAVRAATSDGEGFVQLINRGVIVGNVNFQLSGRDDVFDFKGSVLGGNLVAGSGNNRLTLTDGFSVEGTVSGGDGDDIYTIDNQSIVSVIVEDLAAGGIDTLRSFASVDITSNGGIENVTLLGAADLEATGNGLANVLVGNSGDNALDGDSGADTLRGGGGRDVLVGGLASDTFVFRTGDGKDVVADFNARFLGSDLLDLSGVKGIADFDDLIENHIRQVGDDLVIDAGGGDRIRLEDTAAADLAANMFVF